MSVVLKKLYRLASENRLHVQEVGPGQYRLLGGVLEVDYYPFSNTQVAYVRGTREGMAHVRPETAIRMALGQEMVKPIPRRGKRGKMSRAKRRLWERGPRKCHWCQRAFNDIKEATVDHIIPIGRGGQDRDDNKVLSCGKCNNDKADKLPEYDSVEDLLKARGLL